jgi:hypothetical protein
MRVDGREDRWSVLLPEGLTADRRTARVENVTLQSLE